MRRLIYFFFFVPNLTIGQANCQMDKLIGEWSYVTIGHMGKLTNFDSLKELANNSKETFGVVHFRNDGLFSFKKSDNKKFRSYKPFTYDKENCEIILGVKMDSKDNANLEIVFLDDKYLIYWEDNNPKTYYTHIVVRMTQ